MTNLSLVQGVDPQLLLNASTAQFKEVAHKANAVKQVIISCLSDNVYAHPTLLRGVQVYVNDLKKMVEETHSNHNYNIMMCVGEAIDKHIEGAEHGKTIMADTITTYFELNVPHMFSEDSMDIKLTQILKHHKAKQSKSYHVAMDKLLKKYTNTLKTIVDGCWFLGNLNDHQSLNTVEIHQEIFDSIDSCMVKLKEETLH